MDYITTIEMSKIWGISSRRIFLLCSQGRVPGAEKKGKTWLIPKDAVKPTDPRKKNRWRIGDYNAYGKTRTLVYFKDKICEIKNKFVKAIFYYKNTIKIWLSAKTQYLSAFSRKQTHQFTTYLLLTNEPWYASFLRYAKIWYSTSVLKQEKIE